MKNQIFLFFLLGLCLSCSTFQTKSLSEISSSELTACESAEQNDPNRNPASIRCENLFNGHKNTKSSEVEVTNLKTFGEAMTQGMLLKPDQADLFEVYRKMFFGDPNTSVDNKTLKSVTDILNKHPELAKPHFREYEISTVEKIYETPENLSKYLKSQIQTAGQVRSNLLQIDANLGYWKKIFDYQDQPIPEGLTKDQQRELQKKAKDNFEKYLSRMITKTNRTLLADLKNDKEDYQNKAKALYNTLKYVQEWMDKKGRNTDAIRQAMVDLVHTIGFGNQATQALLKSKNALERIEGLKKVLNERDEVAMDLGYAGHFVKLQTSLKIEFPTGLSKNENLSQNIQKLEKEVLESNFTTQPTGTVRVRSLSIQEAPFRSCLGGTDCSSREYFSKALDPNYNYFTITDNQNNSSGHVTVVLGEAKNPTTGVSEKVAFVDKLQNVANGKIQNFLHAVSLSLSEKGYKLGVPTDIGDHNGLSNMDVTRHYMAKEVLPKLTERLTAFVPNQNQYDFISSYSRAYKKLNIKIYEPISIEANSEITPGKDYQNYFASKDLDKNKLIQDLLNLKNSQDPNDVLKYINSGQVATQLEKLGLFSVKEFEKDLNEILSRSELPFAIRKQAAFEAILINSDQKEKQLSLDFQNFSDAEKIQVSSEIRQWSKSSNNRRKKYAESLGDKWIDAILKSDIKTLEAFMSLKLFHINSRNESGFSTLLIAIHANQKAVVKWLIENSDLDLTTRDNLGLTDIENARLIGKNEIADFIESKRPESKSRRFEVRERNLETTALYPEGTPIISSVEIPAGTFRMGVAEKVTVTISKFEMMSTKTTQKMWSGVFKLAKKQLNVILFGFDPSHFKGDYNPLENTSHNHIVEWIKALNQLSNINDGRIQNELADLFPGHYHGKKYRLPTENEWEYVARMRGLSNGDYAHGNGDKDLGEYAWFRDNSGSKTHPVGLKKPILISGKPIYDIHGNVSEWMSNCSIRGGGFNQSYLYLRSGFHDGHFPNYSNRDIGFRLASDIP